ncbi:MAG: sulfotransferase [Paracoccus sp. (in: a-proteobacteria)]|nr:sulfotransferase [Paracoccus sp. (in: a-proteobacteria)]
MAEMQGALLLGSARCGSTLISRMLRSHPGILSLSEFFVSLGAHAFRPDVIGGRDLWRHLSRPSPMMRRLANPDIAPDEFLYHQGLGRFDPFDCPPLLAITLPHLTDQPDRVFDALSRIVPDWPERPLSVQYTALFAEIDRLTGHTPRNVSAGRVWAERSGGSMAAAATLRRMFPQARLVVLTRAGADTALSLCAYKPSWPAIWMWKQGLGLLDPIHPRRHFGRGAVWPLLARLGGPLLRHILSRPPHLEDCGAFWSAMMQRGVAGLRGARVEMIRYEALIADPHAQAARLGHAIAGAAPPEWLAAAAAMPQARPSRLTALEPAQHRALLAACAPGEAALSELGV